MSYRSGYSETEQFSEVEKCASYPGQYSVRKEEFAEADEVRRTGGFGGRGERLEVRDSKFEEDVRTPFGEFVERKENATLRAN